MASFNYDTRAEEGVGSDDIIEFTINGQGFLDPGDPDEDDYQQDYQCYSPTEDQIALLTAQSADGIGMTRACWALLEEIMLPDTLAEIRRRIADRFDPLGFEDTILFVRKLVEALGGFPTLPSSDSTGSQNTGGKKLTGHLPPKASTRASSTRAGSRTSSTPSSSRKPTRSAG